MTGLHPVYKGSIPLFPTNLLGIFMRAYGSKRTFGDCLTKKHKRGGKIHVIENIKNHKHGRKLDEMKTEIW